MVSILSQAQHVNNNPALVQIVDWEQTGEKKLSEPVSLPKTTDNMTTVTPVH